MKVQSSSEVQSEVFDMTMQLDFNFGLDYILEHFETGFPRRIQTAKTRGQVIAKSKEEALRYFKESNFIDCRINAFSEYEIENVIPNCIFVDLDDRTALIETRILFHKVIGGKPLVLHTGNGYAIIQPIRINSMKNVREKHLKGYEIATHLLRFCKDYLTNYKADPANHPSLKSCLIRIPYSINSKCHKEVKVKCEWDKNRVEIKNIPFKRHIKEVIQEEQEKIRIDRKANPKNYTWLEELMKKTIQDGRDRLLFDVTRYLIIIKGYTVEDAVEKIHTWINSNYYPKSMVKSECKRALKDGKYPRKLSTIQNTDHGLYEIIEGLI